MNVRLILILIIFSVYTYAQDTAKLLEELKVVSSDVEKVNLYNDLAWTFRKINPERGIYYGKKSLLLADSINYSYGKCLAYNLLGVEYRNLGNYTMAIVFYQNALDLSEKYGLIEQEAYGYNNFGNLYLYFNMFDRAIEYLKLADSISDRIKKHNTRVTLKIKSYIFFNLGQAYIRKNEPDSALFYLQKSLQMIELYSLAKQTRNYYSQLMWVSASNSLEVNLNEKKGVLYKTMGDAYTLKGDFISAEKSYFKVTTFLDLNEDYGFAADYYYNLGLLFYEKKDYKKALDYTQNSLRLARKINSEFFLMKSYELLSRIMKEEHNFSEALEYINKAYKKKTEIFNEELENNIQSFEYTNKELKRQAKLKILNKNLEIAEIEARKNAIKLYAALIILMLLTIGFVLLMVTIRKFKKYSESLKVRNMIISKQNIELKTQKEIIEEHSREIKESILYASSIQNSLLPAAQQIEKYFDYFNIYIPRNVVSGDFYWFSDMQPDYLFFITADCTGHGVPAAFISVIAMHLFNDFINDKKISSPKEILLRTNNSLNNFLHKLTSENIDGLDTSIVRFNKKNMDKIIFAGAKLNILIYDEKEEKLTRYRGVRRSVGSSLLKHSSTSIEFEEIEIKTSEYCRFYFYTDGYLDQNNSTGKKIGTKKMMSLIKDSAKMKLSEQKKFLLEYFYTFKEDAYQRDDVTIIGLKRKRLQ